MSEIVTLHGYQHWTTSDGARTIIGPVRHAASRAVLRERKRLAEKFAAISSVKRRPSPHRLSEYDAIEIPEKDTTITMSTAPAEAATSVLPRISDADATTFIPRLTDETITLSPIPAAAPVVKPTPARLEQLAMPLEPRSYRGRNRRRTTWQHIKEEVLDRAYDSDWHDMARNVAGTAMVYAATAVGFLALGKAALWILSF